MENPVALFLRVAYICFPRKEKAESGYRLQYDERYGIIGDSHVFSKEARGHEARNNFDF